MQDEADSEIEEDKDIASDIGADDIDENKNVLLYFRMDEGQGELVQDVTDNKFQGFFNND